MSPDYKTKPNMLFQKAAGSWYPAWAYHMQDYSPLPARIKNITQSLTVTNNLYGNGLRIRLSNRHGASPLSVSDMEVRIRNSQYRLTAAGREALFLAPGEEIPTDPVKIQVQPGDTIEVLLSFPGEQTVTSCCGFNSSLVGKVEFRQNRNTQIPGDALSAAVKRRFSSYVVLGICAIEITSGRRPEVLAVFGDSIVQQSQWYGALHRKLARRLPGYTMYNEGVSGNRVLTDNHSSSSLNPIFGVAGVKRFDGDVFSRYQPDITIIAEGINDLVHPGNGCPINELVTAEDLIRGLDALSELAAARKSRPVLATLTPFFGYDGIWSPEREAVRAMVNQWIRSRDCYIDIDACVRSSSDIKSLAPEYDSGDHLHLNAAAGERAAEEIFRAITRIRKRRAAI